MGVRRCEAGEAGPDPGSFASASYGFSGGPVETIVVAERMSGDNDTPVDGTW